MPAGRVANLGGPLFRLTPLAAAPNSILSGSCPTAGLIDPTTSWFKSVYGAVQATSASRPLVEEAGRRLPGCRIFVQDVTRFEAQGQFDLVILIGGLHHVHAQSAEVLRRLCSALKPCGCLINFEPTQNNSIARAVRDRVYRRNTLFDAQTERGFDLSELNALYQGAGFQIVDQAFPGLLAYVLYYNPDAFPALNRGGVGLVRMLYALERRFYRSAPARWASFATLTLLTRRDSTHTSKSATVSTRA